jgi:hypothetical protein
VQYHIAAQTSASRQPADPTSEIFNDPRINDGEKLPGARKLTLLQAQASLYPH